MVPRVQSPIEVVVGGKRVLVELFSAINVEDVLVAEMQAQAYFIWSDLDPGDRRVDRPTRDYLVRLGVLR